MKIIYLHQYFNTPEMSGGTRSYEMARRLVASGHEVHLLTTNRNPGRERGWHTRDVAGFYVHWLPVRYDNNMSYPERLRAFAAFALAAGPRAAAVGGDVVFATSTPLTIAIPSVYAARRLRVPMVFEVRDLWPEIPFAIGAIRNPLLKAAARRLESFAYRNADRIVALSPGMRSGVLRTGYPPERVTVIPNSADLDLFRFDPDAARAFRERYSWLGKRPMVLYAGTFGSANGAGYLVEVASRMLALEPDVRFVLIGRGKEESAVRELARKAGVLDRNLFMFGALPKNEIRQAFAAATITTSVFIDLKELWHNSANKFFDGLASGTPVAINYGGWQADLLEETGAGLVLPPRDTGAAAEDLLAALRDEGWLDNAGMAARRLAEERFARDRLARELEQVLVSAVSTRQVTGIHERVLSR